MLIAALVFPDGVPDKIFQHIVAGRLLHATSPDILTEVHEVLLRKFPQYKNKITASLALVVRVSQMVYPSSRLRVITADPNDNCILECAVTAGAQFIVTGDAKHLQPLGQYQDIHIVSPREFLTMLLR